MSQSHDDKKNTPSSDAADDSNVLLDEDIITTLQSLTTPGDPDFLRELTDVFFGRSPGVIDQMAQSLEAEDPIGYQRASHSLKGSAANLGALSLAAQCSKMEIAGRDKDLSSAAADVEKVKALYSQVKSTLETKYLKAS